MPSELLFAFKQYKSVTMNNTRQISKEELLYVSERMYSFIMDMVNFVQTNNKQCLNCEKKAISHFVMQNAMLRFASAITLLRYGAYTMPLRDGSPYIDPFSILTLVRAIYENLAFHHYFIYLPQDEKVSDVLIKLWKMTGIRNRIGDSFQKSAFKEKSERNAFEYEELKKSIKESDVFVNSSNKDLLRESMKSLKLLKFTCDDGLYAVEKISYSEAGNEIFKDTSLEGISKILYGYFSAISHPSYLNTQVTFYDGRYNKFVQTSFVGSIGFMRKLIDEMSVVIPELQTFIDNLSEEEKALFESCKFK